MPILRKEKTERTITTTTTKTLNAPRAIDQATGQW